MSFAEVYQDASLFSLSRQFGLHFIEQLVINFEQTCGLCRWFKDVKSPTFQVPGRRSLLDLSFGSEASRDGNHKE
jgi:hypothetical protein